MYQYFKTLQSVANSDDRTFEGIKDLTIAIAKSAGYRRENVTLKNGKVVVRTKYNAHKVIDEQHVIPVWDDALVAKWLMYFRGLIVGKLSKHPELNEVHVDMIQRVFSIYFNSLQLDKIKHNADVVKAVHTSLNNRIGEALFLRGSASRAKKDENARKLKAGEITQEELDAAGEEVAKHKMQNDKTAFNYSMASLDSLVERKVKIDYGSYAHDEMHPLVIQLKEKLKNNQIGLKLLEAMLYSNESAVRPDSIRDYITLDANLSDEEKATYKTQLTEAWCIIRDTLRYSLDNSIADEYDWDEKPKFNLDRTIIQKRLEKKSIRDLAKKYHLNEDGLRARFDKIRQKNANYEVHMFVSDITTVLENHIKAKRESMKNSAIVALGC